MKKKLLLGLLLLCSLTWPTISPAQIASPSSPPSTICIPQAQGALIATSLKKYEALKPAYQQLRITNRKLYVINGTLKAQVIHLDSAYSKSQTVIAIQDTLYKDATLKGNQWKQKAKARNLKFFGTLGVLLLVLAASVGH